MPRQTLNDYLSFAICLLQLRAFKSYMFNMLTKLVIYGVIDLRISSSGSSNHLCLFHALSLVAYGNKVMVVGCAKLATPCPNMFYCLLFKTLNVESKCICKARNSTVVALRSEKTLSMTSITSSSIVDSG